MDPYSEKAFRIVLVGGSLMVAFCLLCAMLSIGLTSWGQGSMFKTDISGTGTIDIRETAPGETAKITAMAKDAAIVYASVIEWGQIVKFSNSFNVFGASDSGYRNQYVIQATGGGYDSEYRATAIEGDFAGSADLIMRNEANPDANGVTTEAKIKLDSANGKSILDLRAINITTGRPVTAFELDAIGNFTFQQYLQLNATERETLTEEDFCDSLDKFLPDDFAGTYIAPAKRFSNEQAAQDEYRLAHPEEFEEE